MGRSPHASLAGASRAGASLAGASRAGASLAGTSRVGPTPGLGSGAHVGR